MSNFTAVLNNWWFEDDRLYGYVAADKECRFSDGTHIKTSRVLDGQCVGQHAIVETQNSKYKLGEPHHEYSSLS